MSVPERPPFTAEQEEAIARRSGSLLLSAAAGSGKTSVLVERFVRSVVEDGVAPGSILAITFTEKAAGELRARVRARFGELGERRLAQEAERAAISTIHGFCAGVLREHAVAAGLDPGFAVLDEPGARELRLAAFDRALATFLNGGPVPRPEALDLVAAYRPDRLRAMVHDAHEVLRGAGREPRLPARAVAPYPAAEREALRAACAGALAELGGASGARVDGARRRIEDCAALLDAVAADAAPSAARLKGAEFKPGNVKALQGDGVAAFVEARAVLAEALAAWAAGPALALVDELLRAYAAAYEEAKRERASLDYDDLEIRTRDLLASSPAIAASYAERFERVMVDEFQDTNRLQLELIAFLDRDDVFTVGDDRQSIYAFRHASVEVFRERRDAMAARGAALRLATNFRSRPEVIEAVNNVVLAEDPGEDLLVPGRAPAGTPRVEVIVVDRDADWPDEDPLAAAQPWRRAEARRVALRIAELVASGEHAASDVVVLLRAAGDMATYERAIEDAGLATLATGGRGFWARQQVGDLCAYLAALVNPRDERALLGVLASPLGAAASLDALALLAMAAREPARSLWDVLSEGDVEVWGAALGADERARIAGFARAFADERIRAPRLGLDTLLERAVARSRYDEHVLRLPGGARRLANVAKLIRLAAAFEAERGRDVRALVDRALGELEADAREPDAPVELAGLDAVRLMTIHAAKGLEFPCVVVADLGRAPNTQTPDLLVDGDRVGLRLVHMHGDSEPALDYDALRDERLDRESAEDRRLYHVAMTRAEERLILVGATTPDAWPDSRRGCPPIVWLAPATGVEPEIHRPEPILQLFDPTPKPSRDELSAHTADNSSLDVAGGVELVAAAPAGPPVGTVSYTSLTRYAQCPYRFYLERVLNLPPQEAPAIEQGAAQEPEPEGIDPLQRGSLAHELLETLPLDAPRPPTPEEIKAFAAVRELQLSDEEAEDLRGLVDAAIGGDVLRRVREARVVHREQWFAMALTAEDPTAPLVNGVVDLLAIEPGGGALIVDYKTDSIGDADPERIVATGYGIQRAIYALAALRAHAPHVEVVHLFLERPDEPAVARYDQADAPELQRQVAERAAGLVAHDFPVAKQPHRDLCATCPGRGGLCSWPEEGRAAPAQRDGEYGPGGAGASRAPPPR